MGYSQGVSSQPNHVNNFAPQQIINHNLIIPFDKSFLDSFINQNEFSDQGFQQSPYASLIKSYGDKFKEINNLEENCVDMINTVGNYPSQKPGAFQPYKEQIEHCKVPSKAFQAETSNFDKNIINLNENYTSSMLVEEDRSQISKTTDFICFVWFKIKGVFCRIIEFFSEFQKNVDCDFSLIKINFQENLIEKEQLLFKSVIQVFENLEINLPETIYLNYENKRYNLYFKLKNPSEEMVSIANKYIQFIHNFNKYFKFSKDIDFKIQYKKSFNPGILDNSNFLATELSNSEKKRRLAKLSLSIPTNKIKDSRPKIKQWEFKRPLPVTKPLYDIEVNEIEHKGIEVKKFFIKSNKGCDYFKVESFIMKRLDNIYKVIPSKKQSLQGFFFNIGDFIYDSELKSFFLAGVHPSIQTHDISHYLISTLHLDVKAIIKNDIEEKTIARIVFSHRDKNNPINLNFIEPKINGRNLLLLDIEKECNPEELYVKHQVLIGNIPKLDSCEEFFNFICDKFGKLCELHFNIDFTSAIVTFQKKESATNCILMGSDYFYDTKLTFVKVTSPLPLSGEVITQASINNNISIPVRPVLPGETNMENTPSLFLLLVNKKLWKDFKLLKLGVTKIETISFMSNIRKICGLALMYIDNITYTSEIDENESAIQKTCNKFDRVSNNSRLLSQINSLYSSRKSSVSENSSETNSPKNNEVKIFVNEKSKSKFEYKGVEDLLKRKKKR